MVRLHLQGYTCTEAAGHDPSGLIFLRSVFRDSNMGGHFFDFRIVVLNMCLLFFS